MKLEGQRFLPAGVLITLIILLNMFGPISTDMFLSDIPNMAVELNTDAATMNMVLYGFMFALAASILLFGPLTDRYGRKKLLIACLAEFVVSSLAGGMMDNVYALVACRVLQGIGAGGAITISTALVKDCFTGSRMAKVLYVISIIGVAGPLIAPILGAWVISVWDWRMTFVFPAAVALICLVPAALLTETLKEEDRDRKGMMVMFHAMDGLISSRSFGSFMLMVTVFNMMFMGYLSVSSYIYEDTFGVSSSVYTLFLAAALMIGTAAMPLFTRGIKMLGYRRMIPVYFAVMLAGCVFMFFFGDTNEYVFLLTFVLCMASVNAIRPYGMTVLMSSHEGDNGIVSSLINFMFFIIGCIGMVVSTMFSDYILGLSVIGMAACAIYAVMWGVVKSTGYDLRALK